MSQQTEFTPPPAFAGPRFDGLLEQLAQLTGEVENGEPQWPASQFERLAEAGVLGWVIPKQYGGREVSEAELTWGYEQLASACLVTTFVLTQRNGACQRIAGSDNEGLKSNLLPSLCRGELFATVGVSHLTTSRQHLKTPAVQARRSGSSFVFNGTVPWVTGATHADCIVTGGTCSDGTQVLAAIPTDSQGVVPKQPPQLLALNASHTASVQLDSVQVDTAQLIAGPAEQVMKRGIGGGAGSLTTSALALGTTRGALHRLRREAERRPDLIETCEALEADRVQIESAMYRLIAGEPSDNDSTVNTETIRKRANSLVLRSTQAYLAASKGAGFVQGHPAERSVREALFFLVWSCPQPVLAAALREFACGLEP